MLLVRHISNGHRLIRYFDFSLWNHLHVSSSSAQFNNEDKKNHLTITPTKQIISNNSFQRIQNIIQIYVHGWGICAKYTFLSYNGLKIVKSTQIPMLNSGLAFPGIHQFLLIAFSNTDIFILYVQCCACIYVVFSSLLCDSISVFTTIHINTHAHSYIRVYTQPNKRIRTHVVKMNMFFLYCTT